MKQNHLLQRQWLEEATASVAEAEAGSPGESRLQNQAPETLARSFVSIVKYTGNSMKHFKSLVRGGSRGG